MITSHRSPRRHPSRVGFTLVEVMLTLLIMAGIMISITQVLNSTRRTRDTIQNIQERLLAGPAILDRLERDLRAIFIYNRDKRYYLRVRDRVLAGYDADSIDFVCSVNSLIPYREHEGESFRRADFNEVGYRLRPSPVSDEFLELYRREDFGVDEEPFEGGAFSFLHDRVKAFNIEVFEEGGPEAEPLENWGVNEEDEDFIGLPLRVDVELTIELSPLLTGEQIVREVRTMTYKRSFRFPPSLLLAQEVQPIPMVPNVAAPLGDQVGGAAAGDGVDRTTVTDETGTKPDDGTGVPSDLPFGGGGGGTGVFGGGGGGGG